MVRPHTLLALAAYLFVVFVCSRISIVVLLAVRVFAEYHPCFLILSLFTSRTSIATPRVSPKFVFDGPASTPFLHKCQDLKKEPTDFQKCAPKTHCVQDVLADPSRNRHSRRHSHRLWRSRNSLPQSDPGRNLENSSLLPAGPAVC